MVELGIQDALKVFYYCTIFGGNYAQLNFV